MPHPGRSDARVVIIGGGFGGLYASRVLGRAGAPLTVIDRRNFHLFQPLLYQVATGGLSPGDIASPIRAVLNRHPRTTVLCDEAVDVLPDERVVLLRGGARIPWDALVVAAGSRTSWFGRGEWERRTAGLKTVEDALRMRGQVLGAFERAEREHDPARREALLTFVVVGGGPTGVELAGAIAELSRSTLARDFRAIDPARARVILLEAGPRILPTFPEALSGRAQRSLESLGAEVRTGTPVTDIGDSHVDVRAGDRTERLPAATVLWAAGVTAETLADRVAERFGARRDRGGRIHVGPDLSIPGHPEVFVIGDLAHAAGPGGTPLPGIAPVAMQQGEYVARRILGRETRPFRYRNKGELAVIGRHAAVCNLPRARFSGRPAWLLWLFIHIAYLIEYDNRLLVLVQWAFNYVTRKRGARLITAGGAPDA
jgi:NADH dehydrogenase